jgi:hypothetical protein
MIVCLLNDSELRSLGVQVKDYKIACEQLNVTFFQYPIIEMAPPDDIYLFKQDLVDIICKQLLSNT